MRHTKNDFCANLIVVAPPISGRKHVVRYGTDMVCRVLVRSLVCHQYHLDLLFPNPHDSQLNRFDSEGGTSQDQLLEGQQACRHFSELTREPIPTVPTTSELRVYCVLNLSHKGNFACQH